FEILIGKSSQDIMLTGSLHVESTVSVKQTITRNTTIGDIVSNPALQPVFMQNIQALNLDRLKGDEDKDPVTAKLTQELLKNADLRSLVNHSQGRFTEENLEQLLEN